MPWNDNIELPHLNVAQHSGSPLRVLAGPGTGKTFSIMKRVLRLIEEEDNLQSILLVAFTRMAAQDLVRIISEIGISEDVDVKATTLHSLSFSILNKEQVIEATSRTPMPLLRFEMDPLLHDLKYQGLGGIRDLKKNIRAYESAWARLQREEPGWAQSEEDKQLENALLSWLKFHESMLIGELIPLTLNYLRTNPASPYYKKYEHVIVDEFQDLNKAEQVLIQYLIENKNNLCVAGDDDQSIYSFKYAHPDGIKDFDSVYPTTHDEVLTECRRCPKNIVRIAKKLIAKNNRYPKVLTEKSENIDGEIHVIQWNGLKKEAKGIGIIVKHFVEREGIPPGEVLILAQRQQIAKNIEEEIKKNDIDVINYYNDDILNNDISKERYVILNLLAYTNDRVALRWWLGKGNNNWNASPYSKLRSHCETTHDTLLEALEKLKNGAINISRSQRLVDRYNELIAMIGQIGERAGMDLINAVFPDTMEYCKDLRDSAIRVMDENISAKDLLDRLREGIIHQEIPLQRNEVSIMSLHKAKGLEADLVIIPAFVEGLIPSVDRDSTLEEQQKALEENRRLFYVGITRTKKVLILSSFLWMNIGIAKQMKIQHTVSGDLAKVQSSQFISELGPNCPIPIRGDEFIQRRCNNDQ